MPRSSFAVVPTLAALGIAELASPSIAHAEDIHNFSPGLDLSISFGDKTAFGIGLDARYTMLVQGGTGCSSRAPIGFGFFGQATWLNFSAGRFAGGIHGGGEVNQLLALDGELGWSYRTSYDARTPGGSGIHVGLMNGLLLAADLSLRGTIPWPGSKTKPEMTIGIGGRFPPPFGISSFCVEGRPLRVDGGIARAPMIGVPRRARPMRIDEETRRALAVAWLEAAQDECASIPAFVSLAQELSALGAPAELVARAISASMDELRHTELCCALAGEYAAMTFLPGLLSPPPPRGASDRVSALALLAIESWRDGCLGEGTAAARARRAFAGATDPHARAALSVIARDEARHAELGARVAAWCVAEGGKSVRDALAAEIEAEPAGADEPALGGEQDPALFRANGRLSAAEATAAWDETCAAGRRVGESLLRAA